MAIPKHPSVKHKPPRPAWRPGGVPARLRTPPGAFRVPLSPSGRHVHPSGCHADPRARRCRPHPAGSPRGFAGRSPLSRLEGERVVRDPAPPLGASSSGRAGPHAGTWRRVSPRRGADAAARLTVVFPAVCCSLPPSVESKWQRVSVFTETKALSGSAGGAAPPPGGLGGPEAAREGRGGGGEAGLVTARALASGRCPAPPLG